MAPSTSSEKKKTAKQKHTINGHISYEITTDSTMEQLTTKNTLAISVGISGKSSRILAFNPASPPLEMADCLSSVSGCVLFHWVRDLSVKQVLVGIAMLTFGL